MTNDFHAQVERAKRASMVQLLLRCARLVNERGVQRARERFEVPLRASHTTLFPHIDLEGTRLTELARRVGVSKQAVGELVDELVTMGVVTREPDPTDGRAKRVCFTRAGHRSILEGLAVLVEVERELEEQVGARTVQTLHANLLAILDVLEPSHMSTS